jgi:hypothetical protein
MRRSIFERTLSRNERRHLPEMMKITDAGFHIEVPVHHYHRAFGKSQFFNFRESARPLSTLRLWYESDSAPPPATRRQPLIGSSEPADPAFEPAAPGS